MFDSARSGNVTAVSKYDHPLVSEKSLSINHYFVTLQHAMSDLLIPESFIFLISK